MAQRTEPARGMRDFLPDDVRRRDAFQVEGVDDEFCELALGGRLRG